MAGERLQKVGDSDLRRSSDYSRSLDRAMRRRHGIPDDDHRPFNVAYAAVVNARRERETTGDRDVASGTPIRNALADGQRQRQGQTKLPGTLRSLMVLYALLMISLQLDRQASL